MSIDDIKILYWSIFDSFFCSQIRIFIRKEIEDQRRRELEEQRRKEIEAERRKQIADQESVFKH